METIKEIPNFPNYLAYSDGRIFNKKRNKFLKQAMTKDGYLKVTLYNKGKSLTKKTHRFIMETFVPNPNNLPQVNHKDCNKTNNSVNNLEWCSAKENIHHAMKNNLYNKDSYIMSVATKKKIYGNDYFKKLNLLSQKAYKENNSVEKLRSTRKKYAKTEEGQEHLAKMVELARIKVNRQTKILNKKTNKILLFESRKMAAVFLDIDARRISEYIKTHKEINGYEVIQ